MQGKAVAWKSFLQYYPWKYFQVCILPATEEQELGGVSQAALPIYHISSILNSIIPCYSQSIQFQ